MDRTMYCPRCGKPMTVAREHFNLALACPHCNGVFTPGATAGPAPGAPAPRLDAGVSPHRPTVPSSPRDRVTAGLLGIFLGGLGVHRFYLGYVGIGVLQCLLTISGCCVIYIPIGLIWGLIEGILCLTGNMRDAEGRPLT